MASASGYSIPPNLIPYLTGEKKDYSSLETPILVVNCIFIPVIIVTVALRLWVRCHMIHNPGVDDVLMIIAVLAAIALCAGALVGRHFGVGQHVWNLSPGNMLLIPEHTTAITKTLYCCYVAYATAITFCKCSIIASYRRIFPDPLIRKITTVTAFVVVSFWFCSVFAIIFTCVPVQAAWDYSIADAHCIKVVDYQYVAAAFNIATDLTLCLLPLPTLWSLKMPKTQKVILCMLVSIGIIACVASVMRLTQLHNLTGVDISYQTVGTLNWSVVEVGLGIACASMSALRPLASKYLPKIFPHLGRATAGSNNITPPMNSSIIQATMEKDFSHSSTDSRHIYVEHSIDIEMSASNPESRPSMNKANVFSDVNGYQQGAHGSEEQLVVVNGRVIRLFD